MSNKPRKSNQAVGVDHRRNKIDKLQLMRWMADGIGITEIAKRFGCSVTAVQYQRGRVRQASANFNPAVAKSELSGNTINTMEQLRNMNETILGELRRCEKFISREEGYLRDYENARIDLKSDPNNKELQDKVKALSGSSAGVLKIQGNVISIAAEVRKQLELQIKIAETMYNIQMMAEFQEEVIDVLRTVDEDVANGTITSVRETVIKRLKEKRQIRGLLRLEK